MLHILLLVRTTVNNNLNEIRNPNLDGRMRRTKKNERPETESDEFERATDGPQDKNGDPE